jgi:hypothetical protein
LYFAKNGQKNTKIDGLRVKQIFTENIGYLTKSIFLRL